MLNSMVKLLSTLMHGSNDRIFVHNLVDVHASAIQGCILALVTQLGPPGVILMDGLKGKGLGNGTAGQRT
jgi:hypothetical protein